MGKVLVIEDSKVIAPALMGALKLKGVECIWAKDGVQGIEMAKREKPVLILLDLMLPRVSGFEVCRTLKTDDSTWRIPIIIMSTLVDAENKDKAREAGADHFIEKPYSMAQTVEEILKYLPKVK
ncbi:Response regulator receiver protein [Elusimicrobium minutum Pei191]|uniref:Response regulator receiver protein n=1 Tax=Elusimicrobium minutum (strain Pei191) TaxID=445932 RepID=B2KC27_ELUMP|nr:response regulator [Elusimicrobium minutum]ACC98154.1 Response regulator receiver protein [Elusimicrobium minutum Pei191]